MSEQATAEQSKTQKTIQGIVVSDKMAKTIIIEVRQRVTLPGIKKIVRRTKRIKVHDENGEAGVGDLISAVETRPLSKQKRHKLLQVIEKAK